jgi:MFS family permease
MSTRTDSARTVRGAAIAIFVIFGTNGFIFASWAARIPSVTQTLGLSTGEMGAVLLVGALGSLVSLPLTGSIVDRIGLKATIRFGGSLAITAAAVIAVGLLAHSVWVVTAGMVLFGSGIAFWDVAQNIGGADVEHRLGRTVMPQFHAAFSGGAVLGALLGAALSAARIDLALHLFAIVVVVAAIIVLVPRYFLAHDADGSPHEGSAPPEGSGPPEGVAPKGSALDAWRHPRTVLIGVVVLGATLTEGAGNDWISKGVVDGLGASEAAGAALFAVFVGAMTVARWFGGRIIDRIGRVAALRLSMLSALIGLTAYSLASTYLLSAVGAVFWGLGAALAFPMGMSAAADDPRRAAARVSVVSTIGYIAFLAGPPFLGFLGDHLGLRHALLAILVPILVALALAGVTRKEGSGHGAAQ